MSRMNASWSNPNHLSESIPDFLRSPMTVAIGASILAHGIFFLGLPVVANSSNKADLQPIKLDQTALTDREKADLPPSMTQAPTAPLSSTMLPPTGSSPGIFQDSLKPTPVSPSTTPGLSDDSFFSPKYDLDQPTTTWPPPITTDNSATIDLLTRQRNDAQDQLAAEKARNLAAATKDAEKKKEDEKKELEKKETEKKEAEKKELEKKAQEQAALNKANNLTPTTPQGSPQLPTVTPQPGVPPTTPNPQSPKPVPAQIAYARANHQQAAERVENGFVYNVSDTAPINSEMGFNTNWVGTHITSNPNITAQVKKSLFQYLSVEKEKPATIEIFNDFKPDQVKDFKGDQPLVIAYLVDPSGVVIKDSVGIEVGSGYASINKLAILELEMRLKDTKFKPSPDGKYMLRKLAVKFVRRSAPPT
jgi:hypothetical protein